MASIFTEMDRDAIRTSQQGQGRRGDGVGFGSASRLSNGSNVIDVDAESDHCFSRLISVGIHQLTILACFAAENLVREHSDDKSQELIEDGAEYRDKTPGHDPVRDEEEAHD